MLSRLFVCLFGMFVSTVATVASRGDDTAPLNVLLITSGCCHDYDFQAKALQLATEKAGVAAVWTVVNEGGKGTEAEIDFYGNDEWSKGFDVVVHNECFAATTNPDYIRSITRVHKAGVPAVVIHCAMHTYRDADIDDWREFLGVTSRHHEHQARYPIKIAAADHPIMRDYPEAHTSAMDELYIIEKVWPNTTVLATSDSQKTGKTNPVIWTNQYGNARVFGTTYGHSRETFEDEVYLETLVRGMLWAAGRLE
ncbi:ThuA domain-containing protein [Neorhodopirellula pilleata]|uniref:Trehalose utilization n=1 Tax=Neorhodopirellula pilleata TaxID=2714738 RepID=A0A5C6A693_9BACT|nr:ThuA domain-containing protein [Neorhodopirellula pilleata]TWT95039.1 Trehalose utilization [Neorhodopirellula pilleata]